MITVLCLLLVEHLPVLVLPRTFSTEHFENFIWLAEQEIGYKISQTKEAPSKAMNVGREWYQRFSTGHQLHAGTVGTEQGHPVSVSVYM